jgi:hypothetical protein
MPKRSPKLILAAERAAEVRRIVARQEQLIAGLKATGRPTLDAELYLKMYIEALKPLEAIERKLRDKRRAKTRETKKGKSE